jgi:hypothetical protein
MTDDFLGGLLLDDGDSAAKPSPAFITYPPIPAAELLGVERVFRLASSAAVKSILFTREDEDTGGEVWDDVAEAERWRAIMDWPVLPTIAEASAFKDHHVVKMAEARGSEGGRSGAP